MCPQLRARPGQYLKFDKAKMSFWEAFERLQGYVDSSDPDINLPNVDHAFQTAEAARAAGRPGCVAAACVYMCVGVCVCGRGRVPCFRACVPLCLVAAHAALTPRSQEWFVFTAWIHDFGKIMFLWCAVLLGGLMNVVCFVCACACVYL